MKKLNLLLLMLTATLLLPLAGCGHDDEPDPYKAAYKDLSSFNGPIEDYYYTAIVEGPVSSTDKYVEATIIDIYDLHADEKLNHDVYPIFKGHKAIFRCEDLPHQTYNENGATITFKINAWKGWSPPGSIIPTDMPWDYWTLLLIVKPFNKQQ